MLLAEVAPAAPALAGLLEIAVLLLAFALVYVVRQLLDALFGWLISALEAIPAIGGDLASPFKSAAQAVANALGTAEHAIDSAVGSSWHLLARYTEWMWRELRGHAVLLLELATGVYPIMVAVRALKSLIHHLTATNTASSAKVKTLEKEYHGIEAKVRTLERDYSHGIGEDVLPRLKTLEKEAANIENVQIPAAIAAQQQSESAISNLYDWIKGKASIIGVGTITTAVAAALSALGLDWLACRSRNSVNGKSGCNLWNDIEGLLGAAIVTGLALDLPTLIAEAQSATPGIVDRIEKLAGLKK